MAGLNLSPLDEAFFRIKFVTGSNDASSKVKHWTRSTVRNRWIRLCADKPLENQRLLWNRWKIGCFLVSFFGSRGFLKIFPYPRRLSRFYWNRICVVKISTNSRWCLGIGRIQMLIAANREPFEVEYTAAPRIRFNFEFYVWKRIH